MSLPEIYGFNECSEATEHVFAPSIFLGNCNLRCPCCMNSKLVLQKGLTAVPISEVKDRIRAMAAEWIIISGGEPTCTPLDQMKALITELKGMGLKIGMSTNGIDRDYLDEIINDLNYIAMDVKSNRDDDYFRLSGSRSLIGMVVRSKILITQNKIDRDDFDYEIRTTLYPPFIHEETLDDIGGLLRPDDKWVLQQFRRTADMLSKPAEDVQPYCRKALIHLLEVAQKYTKNACIKYV